jgi:glycosyltransferase involved in cell wall biosynthesis
MNPVVSVIIPVYKTERYIRKCIDSVLEQTYSDLQIILVDDGSPDSCPDICDEYVKKDPRCCVIHKSNGGVSSARNAGLDAATGDYICFVDSDDMLMTGSIETLCSILVEQGSQYVAGVCLTNDGRSVLKTNKQIRTIDIAKKPSEMLEYITRSGSYYPYAKIYDRGIFNKYQIRFDENLKSAILRGKYYIFLKFTCVHLSIFLIFFESIQMAQVLFRG